VELSEHFGNDQAAITKEIIKLLDDGCSEWRAVKRLANLVLAHRVAAPTAPATLEEGEDGRAIALGDSGSGVATAIKLLSTWLGEQKLLYDGALAFENIDDAAQYGQRVKLLVAALNSSSSGGAGGGEDCDLECVVPGLLLHKDRFSGTSASFLGRGASGVVSTGVLVEVVGSGEVSATRHKNTHVRARTHTHTPDTRPNAPAEPALHCFRSSNCIFCFSFWLCGSGTTADNVTHPDFARLAFATSGANNLCLPFFLLTERARAGAALYCNVVPPARTTGAHDGRGEGDPKNWCRDRNGSDAGVPHSQEEATADPPKRNQYPWRQGLIVDLLHHHGALQILIGQPARFVCISVDFESITANTFTRKRRVNCCGIVVCADAVCSSGVVAPLGSFFMIRREVASR
jgi:hypothetical protein